MLTRVTILLAIGLLDVVVARPANDEPTEHGLASTEKVVEAVSVPAVSRFEQGKEIVSGARNNVASLIAAKNDIIADGRSALQSLQTAGPFASLLPVKTRETVRLESQSGQALLEKPVQPSDLLGSFLRPTPLVDGIREEEKYGNTGDRFAGIGRAIVNGFEGFSNILNNIVDFPAGAAKKTSRGITEALNQIGARLVGLQK